MTRIALSPKSKKRANETRELTRPIVVALNKLDGVRVARNNTGRLFDSFGNPVKFGLGKGSSDIVGIIRMPIPFAVPHEMFGRVLCLEVKRPRYKPSDDQLRWLATVRRFGGFACVVHSVDEAIDAVTRCKGGESE